MFGLSPWELAIFGIIAVLLFGSRLPGVARSLGRSIVEFKHGLAGVSEATKEIENEVKRG
jgi:sec-independent protein translocase protein TatA